MAMQGVDVDPEKINWQELAAKAEPAARQEVLDTLILEQLAESLGDRRSRKPRSTPTSRRGRPARHVPPASTRPTSPPITGWRRIRHGARIAATVDEMIRRAGGEVE